MTMNRRIRPWRSLSGGLHAALVLGLPFVVVRGESALRFDVPSLTVHFFGAQIGMDEFFLVLVVVLLLTFLIAMLTVLLGRIWCGWLCPQTVVSDLTQAVDRARTRGAARRAGAYLWVLAISPVLAASIIWYFVSPYEFFPRLVAGSLGPIIGWSWAALTAVTFLNFAFLRRSFCATVCPYAKMQGVLYDDRTLVIAAADARMEECMRCDACVRACPVAIDVRAGLNASCINCAECIDACSERMERKQKRSLIGYRFGTGSAQSLLARRPLILSGAVTVFLLGLLIVLLAIRQPLDVDILPDPSRMPRRVPGGAIISTFVLSLKNRTAEEMTVRMRAASGERQLSIVPDAVVLGGGEHRRMTVRISREGDDAAITGPVPVLVTIEAGTPGKPTIRMSRRTVLLPPWTEGGR